MNIFVSEYVCGGAWSEAETPRSLIQEGRAMLEATLHDLSTLPDCRVSTTLDAGQHPLSVNKVDVQRVAGPGTEQEVFDQLAADADVCLIIAPELGNVLHDRCEMARAAGATRLLNPPSDLVALCSDKLRLSDFLTEHSIPTIPTEPWTTETKLGLEQRPLIVKPRFGAGSQDVRLFDSHSAAENELPRNRLQTARPGGGRVSSNANGPASTGPGLPFCQTRPPSSAGETASRQVTGGRCVLDDLVAQPYIPGTAVSVGVLCYDVGEGRELLPVALQRLSHEGRFRYLGGCVPWHDRAADEVLRIVERACQVLPGLVGYVGFDLVVPVDDGKQPVLVEINPRLTTSYLGYRILAQDNLAARLLQPGAPQTPIRWSASSVSFLSDGSLTRWNRKS